MIALLQGGAVLCCASMTTPHLAFGTPRRLPKPASLPGRVVVLDVAFAANVGGSSFEKVTAKFLRGLGDRLAMWIDHHDHDRHADYADDPRFVLRTKAQHGACPELVTPERVALAGDVDTICCHVDFDGLCSAAKWMLGGEEPYEGADDDARAIDTRLGTPSPIAETIDRALRAKPKDDALKTAVVHYLAGGAKDEAAFARFVAIGKSLERHERESRRLAEGYEVFTHFAICDAKRRVGTYDKTLLLLLGQERATVSVVHDETTVTVAARFDSGVNLLELFGLEGGMPTRVSLGRRDLSRVVETLETWTPGA